MKTISDRIREKTEEGLRDEIIELLKPICSRIESTATVKRQYWIMSDGKRIHWLVYVKQLETLIYNQEIENRVDQAIEEFMAKI